MRGSAVSFPPRDLALLVGTHSARGSSTMKRFPLFLGSLALSVALGSLGCAAPTEEDAETGGSAVSEETSLHFDVVAFATEKKTAEYGTSERLFGTARADDRM